jgi:hypothetical protein
MEQVMPKERAIELIKEHSGSVESALEYVDETIRVISWGADIPAKIKNDAKQYYFEVKQELENLKNK